MISPSPELRAYVAGLAERADKVSQADKHDDNMLKICSDGRKAALDLDLVGVSSGRAGKVGAVIQLSPALTCECVGVSGGACAIAGRHLPARRTGLAR